MRRLLLVPALMLALLAPAFAQFPAAADTPVATPATPGGPVAIGQAETQVNPNTGKVAIVVAPPVPAEPSTSFSIGTWIADLLGGLVAIFGSVIATFITKWVMAVAKKAGADATQAMSDRLDQIIENGLHSGAAQLGHDLTGKLNVEVKNQVIADAVSYAQSHGADTIKNISGLDVNDPKTVEALQARAAKALATVGPDVVLAPVTAPPTSAVS